MKIYLRSQRGFRLKTAIDSQKCVEFILWKSISVLKKLHTRQFFHEGLFESTKAVNVSNYYLTFIKKTC